MIGIGLKSSQALSFLQPPEVNRFALTLDAATLLGMPLPAAALTLGREQRAIAEGIPQLSYPKP